MTMTTATVYDKGDDRGYHVHDDDDDDDADVPEDDQS